MTLALYVYGTCVRARVRARAEGTRRDPIGRCVSDFSFSSQLVVLFLHGPRVTLKEIEFESKQYAVTR